jgi:16S rRNA (guanine966-N2)-methyltransferase
MKAGKIRIVGGKWRRRLLSFPGVSALRPTPDAVRETVFNWLMPYIQDRRCLDLYAGSGALGFEAVSRGAASAVLVEKNPKVVKALRQNKQLIDTDNQISVTACTALQYISTAGTHFGLVFLDPPFATDELEKACYQLQKHGLIAPDGLIYLEHASDRKLLFLPEHWRELKNAQRGGVRYTLYHNEDRFDK